jgi:TPR repeat protein
MPRCGLGSNSIGVGMDWREVGRHVKSPFIPLACCNQCSCTVDLPRAMEFFNAAADGGLPVAQYNLGVMRLHGTSTLPADRGEAMRLFGLAAEQGYAPAQNGLGIQYMDGENRNVTKAFEYFKLAADGGSTDGMINAANMLKVGKEGMNGEGPPKDYKKALYYFGKAALEGHASALYMLGVSYRDRKSWITTINSDEVVQVENDREKYNLPLKHDCLMALIFLKKVSELTIHSEYVRKGLEAYIHDNNVDNALYYYSMAAELGYITAISNAAWLHQQRTNSFDSTLRSLHSSLSFKRFMQGAMQDDTFSLVSAGDIVYFKEEKERAVEFYMKGLENQDARSAFNLAYMSMKEEGGLDRNATLMYLEEAEDFTEGPEVIAVWALQVPIYKYV